MNIGWLVLSRMRSAVRRLCGQPSGGPIGVADQSWVRVNAPISPPPARKSARFTLWKSNIQDNWPARPRTQPERPACQESANVLLWFWFQFIFANLEQKAKCVRAPLFQEARGGQCARNHRAHVARWTPA